MNSHQQKTVKKTTRQLLDDGIVLEATRVGVQRALRIHKALGNPVVQNINGEVVLIQPEDIKLDEPRPPLFSDAGLPKAS